jgi:hypothetical protein
MRELRRDVQAEADHVDKLSKTQAGALHSNDSSGSDFLPVIDKVFDHRRAPMRRHQASDQTAVGSASSGPTYRTIGAAGHGYGKPAIGTRQGVISHAPNTKRARRTLVSVETGRRSTTLKPRSR